MQIAVQRAADTLLAGGVIAYPTEGVFGLGCLPDEPRALLRLLAIKGRAMEKGLILIAAEPKHLEGWVADEDIGRLPPPDASRAITWIVRPGPETTALVTGANRGVAVRLTTNAVARDLCRAVSMPVTSTSANFSGRPVARNRYILQRQFSGRVDFIVPGHCGPGTGPSEIRELSSGKTLRPGKS
jgi:L-threonylcarbamoyladenylate synthase